MFNFITKKLYENYKHIILNKINIDAVLDRPEIKNVTEITNVTEIDKETP